MTVIDALTSARFIVDAQGKRTDVVLSLGAWETLVGQLEDLEDLSVIRERWASPELRAGWPMLDQVRAELAADGLL